MVCYSNILAINDGKLESKSSLGRKRNNFTTALATYTRKAAPPLFFTYFDSISYYINTAISFNILLRVGVT